MTDYSYGPPSDESENAALLDILAASFHAPAALWTAWREALGAENIRVVRDGGGVIGGLGILRMGQWFAGRCVPMAGIAAVGVNPGERGGGAARDLMAATVRELRASGIPLSTLFASTQRLYRKVGYEQAGTSWRYTLPVESLPRSERDLPVRRVDPDGIEAFRELRSEWSRRSSGTVERGDALWRWTAASRIDETVYAYAVGHEERLEGYVVFTQKAGDSFGYDLLVRDMVALTPAALLRLLTFFADHRSLARDVAFPGSAREPALALIPEQSCREIDMERFLLRVCDVEGALAARGYPDGVDEEIHLEVLDALIPENDGRFLLRVSGGRGEVSRGGLGQVRMDVKALAPLYAGYYSAKELSRLGWIDGDEKAIAAAARAFAGPEPWMADRF